MRQRLISTLLGCVIASIPCATLASNIAFDTAGDSAYNNGWTNGSNGGYGWGGGWVISSDSYPQPPIAEVAADPALGGIMNSPAVADGRVWAITDTTARRLLGGALAPGQTVSVDLDGPAIEFDGPASAFGLVSYGKGDFMLGEEVFIKGGFISYYDTGIPVINGPIAVSLTMEDNGNFTFDIRSLASPIVGGTYSFEFWSGQDEISIDGNATVGYANNLSVTPEPSAFLLSVVASLVLLCRRKRAPKGV